MTAEKVKYGILSYATIVPRFVRGMRLTEHGEVIAIAARSAERAEKAAEDLNIPEAYGDYDKIIHHPDADAVYVPLPNSLHYEYAKKALLAGKHVISEKPFVLHAEEAEELFSLAEEKGLFITEAIKTPFLPLYRELRKIIFSGKYGRIRFMSFRQSYREGPYTAGWNRMKEYGGGVLYGNEAYFFRMAEFFAGKIVSCTGTASFPDREAEDQCCLTALTENGCPIQLALSSRVLFDNGLTIYMDRARIEIPDYWKASKAVIEEGDGTVTVLEYPCPFELQYEMEHYSRCILEKRTSSPINTPDMTIRYISMCEKLYESFETPQ